MTKNNLKVVKSTKDKELENKEKNKALEAAISAIPKRPKSTLSKCNEKPSAKNIEVAAVNANRYIIDGFVSLK